LQRNLSDIVKENRSRETISSWMLDLQEPK